MQYFNAIVGHKQFKLQTKILQSSEVREHAWLAMEIGFTLLILYMRHKRLISVMSLKYTFM